MWFAKWKVEGIWAIEEGRLMLPNFASILHDAWHNRTYCIYQAMVGIKTHVHHPSYHLYLTPCFYLLPINLEMLLAPPNEQVKQAIIAPHKESDATKRFWRNPNHTAILSSMETTVF